MLEGSLNITFIKGRGEMFGTGQNTRYILVEGKDDAIFFQTLRAEDEGNVWCLYDGGKDFVIKSVAELDSLGYHSGIGIVDPDYDQKEYLDGVIPLDKNNLEALLLSSDSFDSVISSLAFDFNQEKKDEMIDFIISNGKKMAEIRIFQHELPKGKSFKLKYQDGREILHDAIESKGFNSNKFAELCLKKTNPKGKKYLKKIHDGKHRVEKPQDFDSNCWRWINGKDGIALTIEFINNNSNLSVDGNNLKRDMIKSYSRIHFNSEKTMIQKILSHQYAHNVVLFRPEALGIE